MSLRTLKIDDATGDVAFEAGTIPILDGKDALKQRVRSRLRVIQGEWFLDTSLGLPLRKDLALIEAQIRSEIEAVDGIRSVTSIELDFDRGARALSVTFEATSNLDDETIVFAEAL